MQTVPQPDAPTSGRRIPVRTSTRQVNRRGSRTVLDLLDASRPRLEPADAPQSAVADPPARADGSCRHCGSTRLLALTITLTDGTPVAFTSCRSCERRDWTSPEGVLDVDAVLVHARRPKAGPAAG